MDVRAWLEDQGLGQYAEGFASNDVDAEVLRTLTADDLKELGVVSLGHRKKLLAAIAELAGGGNDRPSSSIEARAPRHLAERVLRSRAALEGERKQVTVLFADVKGSLALIEDADPEDARRILDAALGVMMDAVHRYEGTVNKVLGDGIMALFGAPIAHEDHAVRACFAALAIQRAMQVRAAELRGAHGVEISARVGLHSGEVLVRTIGNDLSMDYDAIGQTVHLASRMEQLASPGTIRLTAATASLAEGFVELRALGPVPVKGLSQPVEAFDLTGVGAARTRLQAAAGRGLTPFVGRQDELAALDRARELAVAGQGQVVALVGDPGVGKSRLFYELTRSARMRPWLVIEGTSVSSGSASSWAPVVDLLKPYFDIAPGDDRRRSAEKVLGKILLLDESLKPILPVVLALLDLPVEDAAWQALDPPQRRRRTLDGLKALLARESQRQPLALILEDLHWIDSETQALLDSLVESMSTCRILLLVNYRPEHRHGWGSRAHYTQLRIDPLEAAGAEELLSNLLGDATGLSELRQRLLAASEGNPLFLEESVRNLADAGVLSGARGAYRLIRQPDGIEVPASVAAIIAARIDRLSAAEKALLQLAAVIGEDVPLALLETVSELPADELHRVLADLRSRELLYEARLFPDIAYAFRHGLTRRVAYDGLLHESRRTLHARVAEVLEARHTDHLDEIVETLAHHFEQGSAWSKAAEYFLRAADKAKRRWTYPSALELARKAREITARDPALESVGARALELQGDLHSLMGELEAANQSYNHAIALITDHEARRRIRSKRHRTGGALRDGARIAYYLHGAGEETLLFVNPVVYGLEVFQPIVERLCQEFLIVTIDPRGTGSSDPLQRPYGLSQHAGDVRAVIEQAGVGAITGIGISRGSNLLVRLAHEHPGLVRRLVLIGAPTDVGASDSPAQRVEYLNTTAAFLANDDLEGLMRYHIRRVLSEPDVADLAASRLKRWLGMPRETILSFYDRDPEMDIRPLLAAIRVPTLIVHGTEDRQVPFAAAEYLAAHIPGAQLYPFKGYGHVPLFTATHEFCDVLRRFVRSGTV
ncbi:MAG TPA: alpha/beta fold hydrolase [Geminicoccaceae bacterium]|nr:alpha/beta fold hydrolase [Geminicoccaceae bacterium]